MRLKLTNRKIWIIVLILGLFGTILNQVLPKPYKIPVLACLAVVVPLLIAQFQAQKDEEAELTKQYEKQYQKYSNVQFQKVELGRYNWTTKTYFEERFIIQTNCRQEQYYVLLTNLNKQMFPEIKITALKIVIPGLTNKSEPEKYTLQVEETYCGRNINGDSEVLFILNLYNLGSQKTAVSKILDQLLQKQTSGYKYNFCLEIICEADISITFGEISNESILTKPIRFRYSFDCIVRDNIGQEDEQRCLADIVNMDFIEV